MADEDEFYNEAVAPPKPTSIRSKLLLFSAVLFAVFAILFVQVSPIIKRSSYLEELRGTGVVLFSVPDDTSWNDIVTMLERYVDFSFPRQERVIHVGIGHMPVPEGFLQDVVEFDELEVLSLVSTEIQPDALVEVVSQLNNLNLLTIVDCPQISPQLVEEMRKENTSLKIDYRGVVMLGISVDLASFPGNDCTIMHVSHNSAADRAGLHAGDRVVKLDKTPIDSFQTLVMELARYQPGDEVSIEVERGSENHQLRCELDPWTVTP